MGRDIDINISKQLSSKYGQKSTKQTVTNALNTASKTAIQKTQKQLVIWFVIELLIKLQEPQKLDHRII